MTMQPACPLIIRLKHPPRHSPFSLSAILNFADCRVAGSRARAVRRVVCIAATVALMAGNNIHAEPVSNAATQVSPNPVAATVDEAAQRSGIPASWIRAVMQAESGGDARAVSPKGAMGLMQIMPETWATLRLRYGLGADPFDPHDNIIAGAAYLRELHDRYGSPGFLAAYNAGPARYENHVATGQPLPAETRAYVALLAPMVSDGVISDAAVLPVAARSWTEAPLFTVRADDHSAMDQQAAEQHADHHATDTGAQDLTALAPQSDGLFVQTSRRNPRP
jgi:membrane-bound lytic murein transglycosylase B